MKFDAFCSSDFALSQSLLRRRRNSRARVDRCRVDGSIHLVLLGLIMALLSAHSCPAAVHLQSDGFRSVVLSGEPVNGLVPGQLTKDFVNAVMNDRGDVAFRAGFTGPVEHSNGFMVASREGDLRIAVQRGQPAPGAGDGAVFNQFTVPQLTNDGRIAFSTVAVRPGSGSGQGGSLWIETRDGNLRLLALEKVTYLPGVEPTTVASVGVNSNFATNGRGDVVFEAGLIGPEVTFPDSAGMWLYRDDSDSVEFLARYGRPFPAAPLDGNSLGLGARSINDLGQIAMSVGYPPVNGSYRGAIYVRSMDGSFRTVAKFGTAIPDLDATITRVYSEVSFTSAGELSFEADAISSAGSPLPSNRPRP